jgi:CRISPR/Cas system-associated exonuclease Cas4 (RecB family)
MSSFLEDIADKLIEEHAGQIAQLTVVFPNRRAGLFFSDVLTKKMKHAGWSPQILTFEELAIRLSGMVLADKLTLIYRLYEVFRKHTDTPESFDRFYFWGDILLHDFSELDMALVKPKDLFTNISDLKALEADFGYLTEEQKQTIARFWQSFQHTAADGKSGSAQQQFLHLWHRFLPVYEQFRQGLRDEGLAYEGLMYRQLAENLPDVKRLFPGKLVLAGMNALKKAEEQIVISLAKDYQAQLFWDADRYFVGQPVQEAGMFFRQYRKNPVLAPSFPETLPDHFHQGQQREIHIKGVTLEVGQAKQMGLILEELAALEGFDPEKVAIVLPEEHLLFPVLHSLPKTIRRVNVTMGYPLRNTSLYSFVEHLLNLQLEKKPVGKSYYYHHTSLLALLRHPYIRNFGGAEALQNIAHIEQKNAVYISPDELVGDAAFYQTLLLGVEAVPQLFDYLNGISGLIHRMVDDGTDEDEGEDGGLSIPLLERELLYHFYLQVNRLRSLTAERQFDFRLPAFIRLLRQIFQGLRVPFTGEPLRGLQIMGLLESRNLDFDYVFVLSANEGVLPAGDTQSSFIPQNLKKGFGLFTSDQQDAFYAHAFFRLLHRARKVYLFHNTEDMQYLSGEMSRYLYQILYESHENSHGALCFPDAGADYRVHRAVASLQVSASPSQAVTIKKSDDVWRKLLAFSTAGSAIGKQQRLTPSALNTYLDCRLKFYYQYVVRLHEAEVVEEEVDAMVFGNILHKTMEVLYKRFVREKGQPIQASDCIQMKSNWLDEAIVEGFREHFNQQDESDLFSGRNVIAREIVRKMAKRILDHDSHYAPFEILSLEARGSEGFFMELPVKAGDQTLNIALKGIIDRVDRKEDTIRVLDYKTGRDERKLPDIPSLFDREHPARNKAAMQALFYGLLYQERFGQAPEKIVPGLINATELFKDDFDPRLYLPEGVINDFVDYRESFVQELRKLMQEIFNRNVPFDQTTDEKKCSFCPYANICY